MLLDAFGGDRCGMGWRLEYGKLPVLILLSFRLVFQMDMCMHLPVNVVMISDLIYPYVEFYNWYNDSDMLMVLII